MIPPRMGTATQASSLAVKSEDVGIWRRSRRRLLADPPRQLDPVSQGAASSNRSSSKPLHLGGQLGAKFPVFPAKSISAW